MEQGILILLIVALAVLAIIGVKRAPPPDEEALPRTKKPKQDLEEDAEVGINPKKDSDGNTIYY